jgi:hypothetical protein
MYWTNLFTMVIQTSYYFVFDQWLVPWDADNFHSRKKNPWQIPYGTCVSLHSTAWLEKLIGLTCTYNITFITYTVYRRNGRFKCKESVVRILLATDTRKLVSEVLHLEHSFIWCWNLDASGRRSEIPGKFWNVVLEEDGKDQLDWSCKKLRCIT